MIRGMRSSWYLIYFNCDFLLGIHKQSSQELDFLFKSFSHCLLIFRKYMFPYVVPFCLSLDNLWHQFSFKVQFTFCVLSQFYFFLYPKIDFPFCLLVYGQVTYDINFLDRYWCWSSIFFPGWNGCCWYSSPLAEWNWLHWEIFSKT